MNSHNAPARVSSLHSGDDSLPMLVSTSKLMQQCQIALNAAQLRTGCPGRGCSTERHPAGLSCTSTALLQGAAPLDRSTAAALSASAAARSVAAVTGAPRSDAEGPHAWSTGPLQCVQLHLRTYAAPLLTTTWRKPAPAKSRVSGFAPRCSPWGRGPPLQILGSCSVCIAALRHVHSALQTRFESFTCCQ